MAGRPTTAEDVLCGRNPCADPTSAMMMSVDDIVFVQLVVRVLIWRRYE